MRFGKYSRTTRTIREHGNANEIFVNDEKKLKIGRYYLSLLSLCVMSLPTTIKATLVISGVRQEKSFTGHWKLSQDDDHYHCFILDDYFVLVTRTMFFERQMTFFSVILPMKVNYQNLIEDLIEMSRK